MCLGLVLWCERLSVEYILALPEWNSRRVGLAYSCFCHVFDSLLNTKMLCTWLGWRDSASIYTSPLKRPCRRSFV